PGRLAAECGPAQGWGTATQDQGKCRRLRPGGGRFLGGACQAPESRFNSGPRLATLKRNNLMDEAIDIMTNDTSKGKPPRPQALTVRPDGIPAQLKALPQWVVWKYVHKPENKSKPWTKPPFDAQLGSKASSTDPTTWTSFPDALAAYQRDGWDGIGFVPTPED